MKKRISPYRCRIARCTGENGPSNSMDKTAAAVHPTHSLHIGVKEDESKLPVDFCIKCGKYSSGRKSTILAGCMPVGGSLALHSFQKCIHPESKRPACFIRPLEDLLLEACKHCEPAQLLGNVAPKVEQARPYLGQHYGSGELWF